ncbi:O-antigen ligase family protein [Turicibacter sanguinis]|uniref:O-antigen ligase family protein n=1 Tax=Turicibacter sanguinis TaxID=154288 RepID=UPI0023311EC1|nr:O-antigen ligase family protein [Turicibacter sanguinis]MDB8542321.1 O-antigen ligase family protein [Turicibacter sanguinis]
MEVLQEVNETSSEVVQETSMNNFKIWYEKLPVKPIDILNIILLMGYLQSWFMVNLTNQWGFEWDIFLIQNMISTMMIVVSAHYFASNNIEKRKYNWPLFILVGYMVLSNLWSYSPNRGGTWELGIFLMYAVYLKNRYNTKQFLYLFNGFMAIVAILSLMHVKTYPETYSYIYMGRESWMGMFGNKNTLGMAMTVAVVTNLLVILNYKHKNYNQILLIGLCLFEGYLLYKSHSITSWLAAIGIVVVVIKNYFFPIKRFGLYFIGSIILGLFIVFGHPVVGQIMATFTPRDVTFSGRTIIWDITRDYFMNNPWIGYGYNGIWSKPELLDAIYIATAQPLTETHNSIMDILLQFGIVGLLIFGSVLYKFSKNIKLNKESFVLFALVMSLLFIGYGESIPLSFNTPYLILFFYCIL